MRRRDFIAGLGAAAWARAAQAQQRERMRHVGVLMSGGATDFEQQSLVGAFVQALRSLGWVDGQNLRIEMRWNNGNAQLARDYAAELVGLSPNVILSSSTTNTVEALRATRKIPIVFTLVSDPVAQGFVPNLSHPGGNATGFANPEFSIAGKWLDLLKQIVPRLERVALVFNPDTSPQSKYFLSYIEVAARSLGVEVISAPVHDVTEIEPAIERFSGPPNGGLILPTDAFTTTHRKLIVELAARYRLPAISGNKSGDNDFARDGGLMYYGSSTIEEFRGAALYVDRILKGEKPADLPVQAPTRFELVINLKTAEVLGLIIPETLLATADEVIQ
jgi:putative tryptophan/tyrosine transport system substrate-binding protein